MELDWYSEDDLNNATIFNDNSIISHKSSDIINQNSENIVDLKNNIKIENCFEQNLDVKNEAELLNILHYLSSVSNNLRTLIRNKNIKQNNIKETNDENSIQIINQIEYDKILKYLIWIKEASVKIKNFFAIPYRKDNSFDPLNIKPFKTSSYKFCNFKQSCSIHRNKTKTCDKNHFVFDMIINDISKLIRSLKNLGVTNLNNVFDNKIMKMTWNSELETYNIEETTTNQVNNLETEFIVDKILIFKSFDVSSYVLNKMYEESLHFLKFNVSSCQINL